MTRNTKMTGTGITLTLLAVALVGCAGPVKTALPPAGTSNTPPASSESQEPIMHGKVVETMDVAQYTYINLEKDGRTAWAAVPRMTVAVGDEVELMPGTVMGMFTSKTLNRTFNAIYFASGAKIVTAQKEALSDGQPKAPHAATPLPAGHPKIDAAARPAEQAAPAAANPITGKVVESVDAGGYTYICLEKEGKKSWVAVPPMKVSVGEEMALAPGIVMSNFFSKSLNRTFDKIVFSSGPQAK